MANHLQPDSRMLLQRYADWCCVTECLTRCTPFLLFLFLNLLRKEEEREPCASLLSSYAR